MKRCVVNTHLSALCCMSVSQIRSDFTLAAPSPRNTSPHRGLQPGVASPLQHLSGDKTGNCIFPVCSTPRSVPLPSTALLPCGIGCRAPLGSASVWELFDCAVSWQPRGMSLTRAPGQAEPSSSLLVSCSVSRISVT